MRCACIDIGSNTTRLLVAEPAGGGLRELCSQRAYTRIGRGVGRDGELSRRKVDEVADVVATQLRVARELETDRVRVVATAAIRAAANRQALLSGVKDATELDVEVLSEPEEARLAFAGAVRTLGDTPTGTIGMVDVGGGSTELAVGTFGQGATWSASFDVGSGSLTDAYVRTDPPSASELRTLRQHVAGTFEGLEVPPVDEAVAVGGSATALRRLVGAALEHETLERAVRILAGTSAADVAQRFEIDAERVRLLAAGCFLLEEAALGFGRPLRIGRGGLREGVVLELLAGAGARA